MSSVIVHSHSDSDPSVSISPCRQYARLENFKVTREHIDDGTPDCEVSCPVALALAEHPLIRNVQVGSRDAFFSVMFNLGKPAYVKCRFPIDNALRNFVERFDGGFAEVLDCYEGETTDFARLHYDTSDLPTLTFSAVARVL